MTHFVDDRSTMVTGAIDGLLRTSGGALARLDGYPDAKVVLRADVDAGRVAVVSGGGSGHEPAHAGFVGEGMLTAAVCGDVFASPTVDAVLAAVLAVTGEAGCLLVVKNYTGDRLNFGLAAERARSRGLSVETVVVGDDVALPDAVQPRGLAGTLFVHKVAGAVAERGGGLAEVAGTARAAADAVRSIGVSASGADIPHSESARAFAPGTVEIGLGIHGEPGVRTARLDGAEDLVNDVAARLAASLPDSGSLALMVNDLGGLSGLELGILTDALMRTDLGRRAELVVGPAALMTSLGMRGFSISALPLDDVRRAALRAPVAEHTAWPGAREPAVVTTVPLPGVDEPAPRPSDDPATRTLVTAICDALVHARSDLDALDAKVGDGDTGSTVAGAADRVLDEIDRLPLAEPGPLLHRLGRLVSGSMGGSSGVLLSILFTAAAAASEQGRDASGALRVGVDALSAAGGAEPGQRTMLDALGPAADALPDLAAAAGAARTGADATATIEQTTAGRSAYVPGDRLRGVVDPGAEAVAVAFEAAARA